MNCVGGRWAAQFSPIARTVENSRALILGAFRARVPSLAFFPMLVLSLESLDLLFLSSSLVSLCFADPSPEGLYQICQQSAQGPHPCLYKSARAAVTKCHKQ